MKTLRATAALFLTIPAAPALAQAGGPHHGYIHDGGIGYGGVIASRDHGYFSQKGESRRVRNGRPVYDYDRGYPYDNYPGRGAETEERHEYAAREPYCEARRTRDRHTGRDVFVRICRN